jgi:ABC-type dipeptide/oligopeptide/nickel transport system ATPase component
LLANFAFPFKERDEFLRKYLKIIGFDSALIVLKKPGWQSKNPEGDARFWNAAGLVRDFLRDAWSVSLAPILAEERHVDDYRTSGTREQRLYLFIRDQEHLRQLAERSGDEKTFFQRLESADISDLVREVRVWAKRENADDEIPFHEVSDGERQLMTVLGLLRYAREEESLFLLDEPDTHLNPAWQLQYLDIIRDWVGDEFRKNSHLIITTHDPLTMASLTAEQVQLMYRNEAGEICTERASVGGFRLQAQRC